MLRKPQLVSFSSGHEAFIVRAEELEQRSVPQLIANASKHNPRSFNLEHSSNRLSLLP